MEGDQFNCGGLNLTELRMITLAMSVGGGIGVALTATTLIALILAKAYRTVLQRLCLWAVMATLIHLLTHLASIEQYFRYKQQEDVCAAVGFTHNLSAWCEQVFFLDVIIYLLIVVYMQVRGSTCMVVHSGEECTSEDRGCGSTGVYPLSCINTLGSIFPR